MTTEMCAIFGALWYGVGLVSCTFAVFGYHNSGSDITAQDLLLALFWSLLGPIIALFLFFMASDQWVIVRGKR